MKICKPVYAEDIVPGDFVFEGEVLRVTDNYEDVDSVDIYVDGEDDPLTFKSDDLIDIYFDVA